MKIENLRSSSFETLSNYEASSVTGGTNQTGTVITRGDGFGGTIIKTYNPDGTLASIVDQPPAPPYIALTPLLTPSLLATP